VIGNQLLVPNPALARIARFVRGHHERRNGVGHPDRQHDAAEELIGKEVEPHAAYP
jgi:HD-GYP domain-containing protein (c-di-GMP phosphodiesterase class II)